MTLNLNESSSKAKTIYLGLALIVSITAGQYIGAGVFFLINDLDLSNIGIGSLHDYYSYYSGDEDVMSSLIPAGISGWAICFMPFLLPFRQKTKALHGDARFANRGEIKATGLFNGSGVVIGKVGSRYLMQGNDQHVSLCAPTRSGKGVGVVVPTLLTYGQSVFVTDMKGENYDLTSGFRACHGQEVYKYDPLNPNGDTVRLNPLSYISDDKNLRVTDIQIIANIIVPDARAGDIWEPAARSLFLGVVLYLIDAGKTVTLGEVYRVITIGDDKKYFEHVLGSDCISTQCRAAINNYVNNGDKTRQSIRVSLSAKLAVFENPLIDAATSVSDLDFRDLRKRPISLYVIAARDKAPVLAPLFNILIQQFVAVNAQELKDKELNKFECLMVLDEFANMGKMNVLVDASSYIAGYGIRLLSVIQSYSQLYSIYGEHDAKTFLSNHSTKVDFPSSDIMECKRISSMLGTKTVKSVSVSKTFSSNRSKTYSDVGQALLSPDEVLKLPTDRALIFIDNANPIQCNKVRYYKDKSFTERLMPPQRQMPVHVNEVKSEEGDCLIEEVLELRELDMDDISRDDFSTEHVAIDFDQLKIPEKLTNPIELENSGDGSFEGPLDTLVDDFFTLVDNASVAA